MHERILSENNLTFDVFMDLRNSLVDKLDFDLSHKINESYSFSKNVNLNPRNCLIAIFKSFWKFIKSEICNQDLSCLVKVNHDFLVIIGLQITVCCFENQNSSTLQRNAYKCLFNLMRSQVCKYICASWPSFTCTGFSNETDREICIWLAIGRKDQEMMTYLDGNSTVVVLGFSE